jgi:hypothetical protein
MQGEFPRELNNIDYQQLQGRLRIMDTFAKLYAAGQPRNLRLVKRANNAAAQLKRAKY